MLQVTCLAIDYSCPSNSMDNGEAIDDLQYRLTAILAQKLGLNISLTIVKLFP